MTVAELILELDEPGLRTWATRPPADDVKLATWDQLVADLLACIDALRGMDP